MCVRARVCVSHLVGVQFACSLAIVTAVITLVLFDAGSPVLVTVNFHSCTIYLFVFIYLSLFSLENGTFVESVFVSFPPTFANDAEHLRSHFSTDDATLLVLIPQMMAKKKKTTKPNFIPDNAAETILIAS